MFEIFRQYSEKVWGMTAAGLAASGWQRGSGALSARMLNAFLFQRKDIPILADSFIIKNGHSRYQRFSLRT